MIEIRDFKSKYTEDASKLFANNFKNLRREYVELPSKYESSQAICKLLDKMIKDNPSKVALKNGRVVGYLTGYSNISNLKGKASGVYIPEWGHSYLDDSLKEEINYSLYKDLSRVWVDIKCTTHIITYFANDEVLKEHLYKMAFGMLVIDGLRPMKEIKVKKIDGVTTRQATLNDVEYIKLFDKAIDKHLNSSPIFLNTSTDELIDEDIIKNFFSKDVKTFVLEKDDEIVSIIRTMINKGPNCDIAVDTGTLGINFGYTKKNMQGLGLGSILLNHIIKWGLENNMKRLTVDFESQNREGYNFWLRHFKPICISSIRKIDDRI